MEATMTPARDAAIRPSPMATQLHSTPTSYLMGPAVAEALAIYGEWLGIKVTDCGAWSTANQAFQRNYCATHDGRTADQHHGYMATVFAEFFEHRESGFSAGSRV
jgi:hypothetical protein